ncbi:hypothetical protein AB0D14_09105 [Streptomyces sp. NPDC048484]|uniref:hypothetical protein n=1 Tax=Streptomyces sp. NPDC048484 TaxID=3155146 RepID=UPI003425E46D
MLTKEIQAGLEQWAARVDDTRRRVREAGQAERASRIRYAAQCRREAFKYLATTCGSLRGWPGREQVGDQGVLAAHRILLALDGLEIRKVLPLVTAAAGKGRIPARFLAEATDALCVAERRPQVYGTVAGHSVADEARVDALRAALGLPPLAPQPLLPRAFTARKSEPDEPLRPELAVLQGLLRELPSVGPLPRTVRPTVAVHSVWGCAYCGGPAQPDAAELEIRGRVWRLCAACEQCPDTPEDRLLDVLTAKGGISEAEARATSGLARHEGWRLPMRYHQTTARPNHRPQPRWDHIPDTAVTKLTTFAEQRRPAVTPVVMPTQRTVPTPRPHPELLVSSKAKTLLSLPPEQPLTAAQVGKALQLAPGTSESRGLVITTVRELQAAFASPPPWLTDSHRTLAAQREANQARRRTGAATAEPEARAAVSSRPAPQTGPPHPHMLISTRAERILTRPHDQPLQPGQVTKALQIAHATSVKHRLDVRTVGELEALFHSPPGWLLDLHRKLAAERAANLIRHAAPDPGPDADADFEVGARLRQSRCPQAQYRFSQLGTATPAR